MINRNSGQYYAKIDKLWQDTCLALKIRKRHCRRRRIHYSQDSIVASLRQKCEKYHRLMSYLEQNRPLPKKREKPEGWFGLTGYERSKKIKEALDQMNVKELENLGSRPRLTLGRNYDS